MIENRILKPREHCNGKAFLPVREVTNYSGKCYQHSVPCPQYEGSGHQTKWITSKEFVFEPEQPTCPHIHTSFIGGIHFSSGEVWDDIIEICEDCGATLD